MKSYRALAWKELQAQKVMATLIFIAVILSTMMTTVIGQSIGILNAMRVEQAAGLNGNRYATLHQLTAAQANALSKDSRLSYVGKIISIGISDIPSSKLSILLREYEGNSLSAYPSDAQLESGKLPEQAGEIALPHDVLSLLGFNGSIGDSLTLPIHISLLRDTEAAYEYSGDFVLTGILKSNYVGYVTGTTIGIVGTGTASKVLPEKYQLYSVDIRTGNKNTFQSTLDDLTQTYGIPDYCVQYNDILLNAAGISYRMETEINTASGFSYMTMAGVLIGALVLMAAGLVIYNILKIAVTKRVKEYGTLRALGAERRKLYTLVSLQLALLCGVGIPIGVLLGLLSTQGILTAATGFFNPDIFMANSQSEVSAMISSNSGGKIIPLVISAGITLVFAFIAAMPAARYASKVSPTIAMSGRIVTVRRRNRKSGHIRNFEAFYARMNLKRNRGKTAITILSLVMSITVFVALQNFSGLLDASAGVEQMHLGDYSMTSQSTGFSQEDVQRIRETPGVERVSTLKYSLYQPDEMGNWAGIKTSFTPQPGETVQVIGLDEARLHGYVPSISGQDLQALKNGTACLIKNPIALSYGNTELKSTMLSTGESISLNGKSLKIVSVLNSAVTIENEGFINGIQIIVPDNIYDELTGQTRYTELYPVITEDANRELVEQSIQEICQSVGGTWLSYEQTDRQLQESYEQIRLLAWGLIWFVGLIGILNIINTVYTNIHTRKTEIGIQRAIGMSINSLYKTFLWEGAYYGIIATVIGGIAGYICTIFISAATTDTIRLVPIPILPIAEAAILSIAACLLATYIPLKKIARIDIVESIEAVE